MPTHYFVGQNSNKKAQTWLKNIFAPVQDSIHCIQHPSTGWTSLNRTRFGWRRKTPLGSLMCLVSPATLRHSYLDLICNLKCSDHPQDPRMHRPIYASMERLIWECWPVTRVRDRVDNFEHALLPGLWGWVWIVWVLSALAMCLSFPHSTYLISEGPPLIILFPSCRPLLCWYLRDINFPFIHPCIGMKAVHKGDKHR